MNLINARSPFIVSVNEALQIETKIELRIWNRLQTKPTAASYSLTKKIPSVNQRETIYNVSNFLTERIKPIIPAASVLELEIENNIVFFEVKRFYKTATTFILKDTVNYQAVNGYNLYSQGSSVFNANVILRNENIVVRYSTAKYVNAYLEAGTYNWNGFDFFVDNPLLYKLPIINGENVLIDLEEDIIIGEVSAELVCESKYTPLECAFINKFGGWEFLTFFKANTERISTKSENFISLPASYDYNPNIGQSQDFNFSGTQSITVNTGFVPENYKELIQDLMLSEVILLAGIPVNVKSKSTSLKQGIIDKNINYTMEFEYDFNLINDVI